MGGPIIAKIAISTVGLFLFLSGFFLTRRELGLHSLQNIRSLSNILRASHSFTLNEFIYSQDSKEDNDFEHKQRPVFLFIVDALRLDFMTSNNGTERFPKMHNLLRSNASQCMLFGLHADPPTVTSQRLKAITTGTLPTFIDIGSNFNSSKVTEDNFIDKLANRTSTRGLVVLGDDTWLSLFPHQFDVAHGFDSFNTQDLYTVDNGVLNHLDEQLNSEWDLMVVHFLGVDHIGHTHSAHHPLMAERLSTMDTLLLRVVEALPEDAVLLLFGDHGMTNEGEHGGASKEETDSGLFVYSRQPMFDLSQPGNGTSDSADCDLCSTWSWSPSTQRFQRRLIRDVRSSPRMVSQMDLTPTISSWLDTPTPFSSLGALIPELFLRRSLESGELVEMLFANAMQVWRYLRWYFPPKENSPFLERFDTLISRARSQMLRPEVVLPSLLVSHEDDHSSGISSLEAQLLDAVESHIEYLLHQPVDSSDGMESAREATVAKYLNFLAAAQQFGRNQWTQFGVLWIAAGIGCMSWPLASLVPWREMFSAAMTIVKSRSFDECALVVLAFTHAVSVFSNSFIVEEHWQMLYSVQSFAVYLGIQAWKCNSNREFGPIAAWTAVLLAIARSVWSTKVLAVLPAASAAAGSENNGLLAAVLCLLLSAVVWDRLRPHSMGSVVRWTLRAVLLLYWFLSDWGAEIALSTPTLQSCNVWLPRVIFAMWALSLLPLPWQSRTGRLLGLLEPTTLVVLLVSGRGACLSLTLLMAHWVLVVLFVEVFLIRRSPAEPQGSLSVAQLVTVVLYCHSIGRYAFFATGHGMAFPLLQLWSGFIGRQGFHFGFSGLLLALNTFGSEFLALIGVYLVVQRWEGVKLPGLASVRSVVVRTTVVHRLAIVLFSSAAAALHRRHLMVWAVFAPKIAFEAAFWMIDGVAIALLELIA